MQETTRMRKVKIADNTGREAQLEVNEHETIDNISRLYHEMSNHYSSSRMLFTDPAGGRVLSDKNNRLSELFPGHAEIHILILPDTLNASVLNPVDKRYDYDGFIPLKKVHATRVLLIGCGAVGSNVLLAALQTGYRKITLFDYDTVDLHNCTRSAGLFHPARDVGRYKTAVLAEYARDWDDACEIGCIDGDIRDYGRGFFEKFDSVICALDNYEATDWVGACMAESGIPLYRAATHEWSASVEIVRNTKDDACLCCNHERKSDLRVNNCGAKYMSDIKAGKAPALGVSSALAANRLVMAMTRDISEPRTADIRYYDTGYKLYEFILQRSTECPFHSYEDIATDLLSLDIGTTTLGDFLQMTQADYVYTHDDFIERDTCPLCCTPPAAKPLRKFYESDTRCPGDDIAMGCHIYTRFTKDHHDFLDKTMVELGFRWYEPVVCMISGDLKTFRIERGY